MPTRSASPPPSGRVRSPWCCRAHRPARSATSPAPAWPRWVCACRPTRSPPPCCVPSGSRWRHLRPIAPAASARPAPPTSPPTSAPRSTGRGTRFSMAAIAPSASNPPSSPASASRRRCCCGRAAFHGKLWNACWDGRWAPAAGRSWPRACSPRTTRRRRRCGSRAEAVETGEAGLDFAGRLGGGALDLSPAGDLAEAGGQPLPPPAPPRRHRTGADRGGARAGARARCGHQRSSAPRRRAAALTFSRSKPRRCRRS